MIKIKERIKINGTKLRKLYIKNYKMFQDFSIDFTSDNKPLPIIILAGINGSGKTTLLEYIIDNRNFVEDDNWLEVEDKEGKIYNTENSIFTIDGVYAEVYEDIGDLKEVMPKYIENMVYKENILPFDAYKKFQNKIDKIFDGLDIGIEFDSRDGDGNLFFKKKNSNDIFSIDDLSTGEKTLLSKILYLHINNFQDKVILIDEPETSLHPSWQNRVLKLYENFSKEYNCQIVIATHSPHIIGSAKPKYLRLLKKDDDKIVVIKDIDRSYGLEFEDVLTDIMGVENLRTPDIAKDIDRVWELIKDENYESSEYERLYNKLKEILGDLDKDMVLFRLEIARIKSRNAKSK